jgi:O-antigen/teichoic acid export membrane protein
MEWKFSSSEAAELLRHSWPLFLSGLVIVVYQKMDQLFIEGMLNLNLLGNYAAAARISEASNFIPVAICAAIFPGIVHNRDNKILQEKRLIQLYSVMVWSALLISMAGFLVGDEIISFLYKEQYNLAPGLFRILVWNTLVVFFGTAWSIWMVAERKQMYIIISQAVSMSVAFILNLNLIPLYGVSAAAYILVGCQVLNLLIMLTIYKPLATWSQFLSAFRIRNLLDVLKYLRSG